MLTPTPRSQFSASLSLGLVLLAAAPLACSSPAVDPATACAGKPCPTPPTAEQLATLRATAATALDAYLDKRFDATSADYDDLAAAVTGAQLQIADVEQMLRGGRASYPPVSQKLGAVYTDTLDCDHVAYSTTYYAYVPADYDPAQAYPLVFIAHGGNNDMTATRAASVASQYMDAYLQDLGVRAKAILVAPATTRGWGGIGNSVLLSAVSKFTRAFHIDPDRIHVTGQSMGGHMSFRTALNFSDRFGAISPQSGGYDFVAQGVIGNLFNGSGYVTFGENDIYNIAIDSRTNAAWTAAHKYDWTFVEKKGGGHDIYADELPKVAQFFHDHPRTLYRPRVYIKNGGTMTFAGESFDSWTPKSYAATPGHEFTTQARHWLRLVPASDLTKSQVVYGEVKDGNRLEIQAENAEKLRIYLHPQMVDFTKPVTIVVNGVKAFEGVVKPDLKTMIEHVREYDDRGRIFYAEVDIDVTSSVTVDAPMGQ